MSARAARPSPRGHAAAEHQVKLSAHPRARRHIRAAKGWGGLAGFALAGVLSLRAGVPVFDAGLRALAGGIAGYLVAWVCTLSAWRHLAIAELNAARERALERRGPARERAAADPEATA